MFSLPVVSNGSNRVLVYGVLPAAILLDPDMAIRTRLCDRSRKVLTLFDFGLS